MKNIAICIEECINKLDIICSTMIDGKLIEYDDPYVFLQGGGGLPISLTIKNRSDSILFTVNFHYLFSLSKDGSRFANDSNIVISDNMLEYNPSNTSIHYKLVGNDKIYDLGSTESEFDNKMFQLSTYISSDSDLNLLLLLKQFRDNSNIEKYSVCIFDVFNKFNFNDWKLISEALSIIIKSKR